MRVPLVGRKRYAVKAAKLFLCPLRGRCFFRSRAKDKAESAAPCGGGCRSLGGKGTPPKRRIYFFARCAGGAFLGQGRRSRSRPHLCGGNAFQDQVKNGTVNGVGVGVFGTISDRFLRGCYMRRRWWSLCTSPLPVKKHCLLSERSAF